MKRNLQSSRLLLLPVLALLLAGCGEDVPKTADQAVLRAANGLAENKPVVLWDALPTTYQKDVHEVVHSAVGKVDPDLWDQAFKTGQRLTKLLREKKDFILGHPLVTQMMQGQVVDKAEVDKQWDTFVGALDAVVNSEISSYEKAKTVNVGAFLDRTGSKVMEGLSGAAKSVKGGGEKPGEKNELVELYEKLKQTKATLVKEEGDKATVKLEVPGESATEEEFVRIEGKWLPKKMVDEWPKMIAEAKKEIAAISTEEMEKDELFEDAVKVVLETKRGSVSLLQRRLTIGYSRASRLIEAMAQSGILGDYKGSQARECNITIEDWEAMKAARQQDEETGMTV